MHSALGNDSLFITLLLVCNTIYLQKIKRSVSFSSPSCKSSLTKYSIRFIVAPKSNNTFSISKYLIQQCIVKLPISFSFTESLYSRMVNMKWSKSYTKVLYVLFVEESKPIYPSRIFVTSFKFRTQDLCLVKDLVPKPFSNGLSSSVKSISNGF